MNGMHVSLWLLEGRSRVACWLARGVAVAALALVSVGAYAASEEIQVYMDDLSKAGHIGADIHNNYVFSGSGTPDYAGAQPPRHIYRLTPEFYYGLTDTMELGMYLLSSAAAGGPVNYDGAKVRFKYIAPHDEDRGAFWGANVEIGRTNLRVSQAARNAQIKGIYGYRTDRWTFAMNANLDWTLSNPSNPVGLEIDTKVSYKTNGGYGVGFESYNELGPVKNLGRLNQQSQTLFAALDTEIGKVDLNAGIGRGLTPNSDRWLVKFIIGLGF